MRHASCALARSVFAPWHLCQLLMLLALSLDPLSAALCNSTNAVLRVDTHGDLNVTSLVLSAGSADSGCCEGGHICHDAKCLHDI